MKKTKKAGKSPQVQTKDLEPKNDPKGGALQAYVTVQGTKQGALKGK